MLVAAVVGGSAYGGMEEGAPRGGVNRVLSCRPHRRKLGFHLLPPLIQPAVLCIIDAVYGAEASRQLGNGKLLVRQAWCTLGGGGAGGGVQG